MIHESYMTHDISRFKHKMVLILIGISLILQVFYGIGTFGEILFQRMIRSHYKLEITNIRQPPELQIIDNSLNLIFLRKKEKLRNEKLKKRRQEKRDDSEQSNPSSHSSDESLDSIQLKKKAKSDRIRDERKSDTLLITIRK